MFKKGKCSNKSNSTKNMCIIHCKTNREKKSQQHDLKDSICKVHQTNGYLYDNHIMKQGIFQVQYPH